MMMLMMMLYEEITNDNCNDPYTQIVVQSELGLTLKPDPGRRVDD